MNVWWLSNSVSGGPLWNMYRVVQKAQTSEPKGSKFKFFDLITSLPPANNTICDANHFSPEGKYS